MQSLKLILLASLLLGASFANAGGRWGVSYEPPLHTIAYTEIVLLGTDWPETFDGPFGLRGIEAILGFEARYVDEITRFTPYAAMAAYWQATYLRLDLNWPYEVGTDHGLGFTFRLSLGGSW